MGVLDHRQNAELETLNANIQTEKEHLREQNTHLTLRLEAVAQPPTPVHGINADTPLDLMLNVLQKLILVTNLALAVSAPTQTAVTHTAAGRAVPWYARARLHSLQHPGRDVGAAHGSCAASQIWFFVQLLGDCQHVLQTHVPPAASWRVLQGESVGMPQILDLRQILTESNTDLRQPIGLERQLLENCESSDGEVGLSMLQLLKVSLSESSS